MGPHLAQAVTNLAPSTTSRLLNINFASPLVLVSPRSWYATFEGTSQNATVQLAACPNSIVTLTPIIADTTVGEYWLTDLYRTKIEGGKCLRLKPWILHVFG